MNTSDKLALKQTFKNFQDSLNRAVELAIANPSPTRKEAQMTKRSFGAGLTLGQKEIVIRTYNSIINTVAYINKKSV